MNLLQQAFTVEVDHRLLKPSVTEYNNLTILLYRMNNRSLQFRITDEMLKDPRIYAQVRSQVAEWMVQ